MSNRGEMETANIIGGVVAVVAYTLIILVFIARIAERQQVEYALGLVLIALLFPLAYLLWISWGSGRPVLYLVQLGLMLLYLIVELVLDYVLKLDFRSVRWMVIAYAMLFFAATGGMLGVASQAGKGWMYSSIVLFLVMAALAFIQHALTGM